MDSCPLCWQAVAPYDREAVDLKKFLEAKGISERQKERLGKRNPRVHRLCGVVTKLSTEEIILRVVRLNPRPDPVTTRVSIPT